MPRRGIAAARRFIVLAAVAGLLLALARVLPVQASPALAQAREVRIGVLAFRGSGHARQRWQPLVSCLGEALPRTRFRLVFFTLDSVDDLLARQAVDFLITNPGHFVALKKRFALSALATLVRFADDGRPLMRFGSVIFTRADQHEVEDLADARGRVVAAVSERAFGGFLVGWREFQRLGIDLLGGDARLYFTGFPQDRIVSAVLKGKADIGIVRTGLLESMAREGRIDMSQIRVLNPVPQAGFPWAVSSRLYPEWPFVARDGVNRELAAKVLRVLLDTMDAQKRTACKLGNVAWTAPLSYGEVARLLAEFEQAARRRARRGDWILVVALLAVAAAAFAIAWLWRQRQTEELRVQARAVRASGGVTPEQRARFDQLTRRELQVLACLCEGLSSKEIAQRLGIAPKTVEYHRANLLKKTGFSNTTRMVSVAAKLGLDSCPGKTREKTGEPPDGQA